MQDPTPIPFQQVLDALLNEQEMLDPVNFQRLSDLDGAELGLLTQTWAEIPLKRRRALVEALEEASDGDVLLSYEPVARIGLGDPDPEVRIVSIRMLWDEESTGLEEVLLKMQENDLDERVRAGAAFALGHYIYQGELDEIPAKTLKVIEEQLMRTVKGKDGLLVRRKALEALGFSTRPEVTGMIERAFASDDDDWIASALSAMGRSADIRWAKDALRMLDNENPFIRLEAARAAGELDIKRARAILIEMLNDPDDDVRAAVIWSLSQIGGQGVAEALEDWMEENDDVEEVTLIEEALDNLAFNEGFGSFDLLNVDEEALGEMSEFDPADGDLGGFDDDEDE